LLGDRDPSVRSQAAWGLGTLGTSTDLVRLGPLVDATDLEVAVDAVAAVGRIAARERAPESAVQWLCPILAHGSTFARVNALAGLANAHARCPGGDPERTRLAEDPSEEVRAAAARAVTTDATPDDLRALERCSRADPSTLTAARCRSSPPPTAERGPLLVYVVPEGSRVPRPDAFYGALGSDGWLRLGQADRRGAFFDPVAPKGAVRLVSVDEARAEP